VRIHHGHVPAGREVKDGKTAAAEPNVSTVRKALLPDARIVGAAMLLDVRHPGKHFPVPAIHHTADAAHLGTSPFSNAIRRFWIWCETSGRLESRNKSGPEYRRENLAGRRNGKEIRAPANPEPRKASA